jgi:hypothetical protein
MKGIGCSAHLSPSSVQVLALVVSVFLSTVHRDIDTFCFHVGCIQDTVFCVDCIGRPVKHWLSSRRDCYLLTIDCFDGNVCS